MQALGFVYTTPVNSLYDLSQMLTIHGTELAVTATSMLLLKNVLAENHIHRRLLF